jgi:hypothetical protein
MVANPKVSKRRSQETDPYRVLDPRFSFVSFSQICCRASFRLQFVGANGHTRVDE